MNLQQKQCTELVFPISRPVVRFAYSSITDNPRSWMNLFRKIHDTTLENDKSINDYAYPVDITTHRDYHFK